MNSKIVQVHDKYFEPFIDEATIRKEIKQQHEEDGRDKIQEFEGCMPGRVQIEEDVVGFDHGDRGVGGPGGRFTPCPDLGEGPERSAAVEDDVAAGRHRGIPGDAAG